MREPKILVDGVFFIRNVQPVLEAMGWTVRYGVTDSPRGAFVIHSISDTVEPLIPPELREKFTRILDALATALAAEGKLHWHYAEEGELRSPDEAIASGLRQESAATPSPEPGSRALPPLAAPVFDYTTLRKDPENNVRLREYSDHMILVKSPDMVNVVKPDFAARGWIYGGSHYGGGSVGLQVVLDRDDKVVAPTAVLAALREIHVPHDIHHRRPEPAEDGVQEDEDKRPPSVAAAEAERQETTEAAMEAEEEGQDPGSSSPEYLPASELDATGALRLEEGQEMHIGAVYLHDRHVQLRLEIGDNVITVVTTYAQAKEFLVEANAIAEVMIQRGRKLMEEAESDAGKETERDQHAE